MTKTSASKSATNCRQHVSKHQHQQQSQPQQVLCGIFTCQGPINQVYLTDYMQQMCKLVSDKGVADDWTRVRKKQFTKTLLVLNNITIQKSKDQKSQYRTILGTDNPRIRQSQDPTILGSNNPQDPTFLGSYNPRILQSQDPTILGS